jgi:hypothetical protein
MAASPDRLNYEKPNKTWKTLQFLSPVNVLDSNDMGVDEAPNRTVRAAIARLGWLDSTGIPQEASHR